MYDQNQPPHQDRHRSAFIESCTWIANFIALFACLVVSPYVFDFVDAALTNELKKSYGAFAGVVHFICSVSLATTVFLIFRASLIAALSSGAIALAYKLI